MTAHASTAISAIVSISSLLISSHAAVAQSAAEALPDLIVTADRIEESASRTGSSISVITRDTLETGNAGSLVDAFRSVPGLDITENGGPGGTASARIRGANTGQTLVTIDGIRVNDPTAASSDFDFSMFAPGALERIEVLKGPQSALYGSDAMGGVINLITRKARGPAETNLRSEVGSYGTASINGSLSGTSGPWSYSFVGGGQHSNGFSRYGYRIPAIESRFPNLERDGFDRLGGSARIGHDNGEGVRLESGVISTFTRTAYDAASGAFPDTPSNSTKLLTQVWGRISVDTLDDRLTHSLTLSDTRVERSFNDISYRTNTLPQNTTSTISDYYGDSLNAEYQGTLRMERFGTLVFGGKTQFETAETTLTKLLPVAVASVPQLIGKQDTRSAFALWSVPIGERLNITMSGRIDDVVDTASFGTWRATAAYTIAETGTKLRASAGTGAKAPTLYQLYAPTYGNTALQAEQSFGFDAGIDQSLFNGRVTLSLTGFGNTFSNMIEYNAAAMRYFNVSRAKTEGVELASSINIIPGQVQLNTAYTWMQAQDLNTGLTLARRPEHLARFALAITPTAQWLIEPRLLYVSKRFNTANELNPLGSYVRLDLHSEYKIDDTWKVFARGENLTDVRYQEALNYGTTGRAGYAGISATW